MVNGRGRGAVFARDSRTAPDTRQPSAAAIVETADRVVMVLVAAAFACTLTSFVGDEKC